MLWYRLDGHVAVPMETLDEQMIEWTRRQIGVEKGEDPYCVARTELGDDRFVSTVFLSLDHQRGNGPPLLFETMVFPECDICVRYSTWDQALAGHDQVVAEMRSSVR